MKPSEITKLPYAISIFSILWILLSFWQWGFHVPDLSQLIFAIAVGLGGIYIAYDQWFKKQMENKYRELVQMCDSFLNWKLKQEEKE